MNQKRKIGRGARFPSSIPWKGWKDIFRRVYKGFIEDKLSIVASGAAFFVFVSIIPMITATISVYGLISDPTLVHQHVNAIQGFIPGPIADFVEEQFVRIAESSDSSLSLGFIISLTISLYAVSVGMKSLIVALNIAYKEKESRSFLKLNALGFLFAVGTIFLIIIFLTFILALPSLIDYLLDSEFMKTMALWGRWILAGILCIFSLALAYRFGPKREYARWYWLSWGSVIATVLIILVSVLFSVYIQNFNTYNATYGSLATAVIFMLWIYYVMVIILLGAKINAEMEHQTKRDTTTDERREMGNRGAFVADTLGKSKYSQEMENND